MIWPLKSPLPPSPPFYIRHEFMAWGIFQRHPISSSFPPKKSDEENFWAEIPTLFLLTRPPQPFAPSWVMMRQVCVTQRTWKETNEIDTLLLCSVQKWVLIVKHEEKLWYEFFDRFYGTGRMCLWPRSVKMGSNTQKTPPPPPLDLNSSSGGIFLLSSLFLGIN